MRLGPKDALIIVGMQRDHLGEDCRVIFPIADFMREASQDGATIVVTQDWRDEEPCVQGSIGAELHPALPYDAVSLFLRKQAQSAFREDDKPTGLTGYLLGRGVEVVYVAGIQAVRKTARDAANAGFRSVILMDLVQRPPEQPEPTKAELFLTDNVFAARSDAA